MLDVEPEPGIQRSRPVLSLTVPVVLSLAVWGLILFHWASGLLPPPSPTPFEDDWVATEVQQFRALHDREKQIQAIRRLSRVRDPRVTVALIETVQTELGKDWKGTTEIPGVLLAASFALWEHHIPEAERVGGVKYWTGALIWWDTHEAEIRARAESRPQSRKPHS